MENAISGLVHYARFPVIKIVLCYKLCWSIIFRFTHIMNCYISWSIFRLMNFLKLSHLTFYYVIISIVPSKWNKYQFYIHALCRSSKPCKGQQLPNFQLAQSAAAMLLHLKVSQTMMIYTSVITVMPRISTLVLI